ncbi:hypothetical protein [Photorhabdus namnaonensis]|uniref:hypothetical protein n=1 Tax=Photorhabdus namnaonensis TaxID=1851568 RepID=UPI000A6E9A51|nr:hypothetical protein [Photorhabdus namnaonensis]
MEKNQSHSEELVNCQGDTSCRATVRDKYRQEYDKVQERIATCSGAESVRCRCQRAAGIAR